MTFLERISKNAEFSVYVYLGVLYSLQKAEMKDIDKDVEWRQKDFFFLFYQNNVVVVVSSFLMQKIFHKARMKRP